MFWKKNGNKKLISRLLGRRGIQAKRWRLFSQTSVFLANKSNGLKIIDQLLLNFLKPLKFENRSWIVGLQIFKWVSVYENRKPTTGQQSSGEKYQTFKQTQLPQNILRDNGKLLPPPRANLVASSSSTYWRTDQYLKLSTISVKEVPATTPPPAV